MASVLKDIPIVDIAIGLNMIYDIIERVQSRTGVELTPDKIAQYVADRKKVREELNAKLGVPQA